MAQQASIRVDPATEADVPHILRFIRGLAEYEKLPCRPPKAACGRRSLANAVMPKP